ncbi:MAG: hypothetical protein J6C05_03460 [Prevotella sp.]|nr:hypothetical protein [Prevotella sp.]
MTENKTRKPYVKPSMEVIKVETTSILAGSPDPTYSDPWGNGGEVDIELEDINQ